MAEQVPQDSAAYVEFSRLYDLAARLQPNGLDRWSGELLASDGSGYFDQQTGAIEMNARLLRDGLSGRDPRMHARAVATVLQRAAQAGMPLEAPGNPNAVRDQRTLGLNDGIASVRAADDFNTLARMAGYPHLTFDPSQNTGAYAAANGLIHQASGARVDRTQLLDQLGRGPVAGQFDRLAEAVVENRLGDRVGARDRLGVRRELIGTMLHPAWEKLSGQSAEAGRHVAEEIGRALNAKVDEIRRGGQRGVPNAATDGRQAEPIASQLIGSQPAAPRPDASRPDASKVAADVSAARFLTGMAPPGGAGRRPSLGDGSRRPAEGGAAATRRQPGAREY